MKTKTKLILIIAMMILHSVKSQRSKQKKVEKDTLMFKFDSSYLKENKFVSNEFIRRYPPNSPKRTMGVSYTIKKIHRNLKIKKLLSLEKYAQAVRRNVNVADHISIDEQLFESLGANAIIFVDDSSEELKFMEMEVAFYIND